MLHPQALIQLFGYNFTLIEKQVAGISHEQSLIQLPNTPNSLNWLLGHLISARTVALQRVGEEAVWTDEIRARYRGGSQPITSDGAGVLPFERLLSDFRLSQERLLAGLGRMTYEQMCEDSGHDNNSVGQSIAYFQFHEAYHLGQIAAVAVALGKESVWL